MPSYNFEGYTIICSNKIIGTLKKYICICARCKDLSLYVGFRIAPMFAKLLDFQYYYVILTYRCAKCIRCFQNRARFRISANTILTICSDPATRKCRSPLIFEKVPHRRSISWNTNTNCHLTLDNEKLLIFFNAHNKVR